MSLCASVPYALKEIYVDVDTMSGAQLMALSNSKVAEEAWAQRIEAQKGSDLLRTKLLENNKELLNRLLPAHDRSWCGDTKLENKYGSCRRCMLLADDIPIDVSILVSQVK